MRVRPSESRVMTDPGPSQLPGFSVCMAKGEPGPVHAPSGSDKGRREGEREGERERERARTGARTGPTSASFRQGGDANPAARSIPGGQRAARPARPARPQRRACRRCAGGTL